MNKAMLGTMTILTVFGCFGGSARAGTLDSVASPTSSGSAMHTLEDLYQHMTTGATNSLRTGAFTEPSAGPTAGTMHTLNDLYALPLTPAVKTGMTNSTAPNDDGDLKKGLAWPNPRFTVQANTNCVQDNLTGLIWARNANLSQGVNLGSWSSVNGTCNWWHAMDTITNLAGPVNGAIYGGYSDWRMPNVRELHSLIDYGFTGPALCNTAGTGQWSANNPFTGVQPTKAYWASTRWYAATNGNPSIYFASVSVSDGSIAGTTNTYNTFFVWPVRGGQ